MRSTLAFIFIESELTNEKLVFQIKKQRSASSKNVGNEIYGLNTVESNGQCFG